MNAKTYSLCEAVADLAHNFAAAPVRPGDSREVVTLCINWAYAFEKKHARTVWGEDPGAEYIDAIDAHFDACYAQWRAGSSDKVESHEPQHISNLRSMLHTLALRAERKERVTAPELAQAKAVLAASRPAVRFAGETLMGCEFENCWHESDEKGERLLTFATRAEAEAGLREHLKDVRAAVKAGHMESGYSKSDFRIVEVLS